MFHPEDKAPLSAGGLLLPQENKPLGLTVPRLWTPPLRELTPETTLGFDIIDFAAEDLNAPLDPWQEWTVIHGFELLPDGRTRFKKLLILVARQNGKTHLCVVLCLYWMYVQRVPQILGTSTKLEYAKESWNEAKKLAKRNPELAKEIAHRGAIKTVNGGVLLWRADEEERRLETGSEYKIAPANEEGGRSKTVDRLVLDELRQHHDYSAYDAAEPTTTVPWSSMIIGASNAGNDRSVVLNDWRDEALRFIRTGEGDPRVGLIEYSANENAKPNDVMELAQANPNLNRRGNDSDDLLREAETAMRVGGEKLSGFKTEKMCIHVRASDPAVTLEDWVNCKNVGTLNAYKNRIVLCFDFSIDEQHATLVAGAMTPDEIVRIEALQAWDGSAELRNFARDFRAHVRLIKPRAIGWFPGGPAASQAATLLGAEIDSETGAFKMVGDRPAWLPRRTLVEPLRGETPSVCMGFAKNVRDIRVAHSDDALLNVHVPGADKLWTGARWVAARQGAGHCDGYYASAGADYLARTVPIPNAPTSMILP
jgi:hypothetical protein